MSPTDPRRWSCSASEKFDENQPHGFLLGLAETFEVEQHWATTVLVWETALELMVLMDIDASKRRADSVEAKRLCWD